MSGAEFGRMRTLSLSVAGAIDYCRRRMFRWGAQNVSQYDKGAYTGEVSAAMLMDFGCRYVIVGHSERRALYGEDNHTVALKFRAAQSAGLMPVLCVGETLDQREAAITEQVVAEQLDAVIELAGIDALAKSVLAYEPVWAIGTGKTATPDQAQEVHAFIRDRIAANNSEVADWSDRFFMAAVQRRTMPLSYSPCPTSMVD